MLKVSKSVFVSMKFPSFLILKRLQAVTPCVLRYSVIFSIYFIRSFTAKSTLQVLLSWSVNLHFLSSLLCKYMCNLLVSSASWCLRRAAVCGCGTPWTFLLPFFPAISRFFCTDIVEFQLCA